ncbi:hypothetical protein OCJ37_12845 [Xanthomonas sp. AM6]|uniref:hypothetical protein n=1 Tax=Xanthomonas sp. AM6 TaxID=2982531 RepID=UPI0021D9DE39|nr:hypothetical protein [Xanthomonas sp. AM6]UYB50884.1 hypothetical protein OCJ37_12845 [Xanthomonas sp. AM6]
MADKDTQHGKQQGIQEGQQDRAQDEVAKQRSGREDEKLREAHERGPKSGGDQAAG